MKIYYLDALAGSGKTYAIAREADRLARKERKVVVVQPSKLLIEKTYDQEFGALDVGLSHYSHPLGSIWEGHIIAD